MKKVAVIGGGASGLVAACFAAGKGCAVALFEKQKKLGRKILVTGNGRCNISNLDLDVSHYHGRNPNFVHHVFSRFGLDETKNFFQSLGIPFSEEKGGRLYPASFQGSSVPLMLEYELIKRKVDIKLHRKIDSVTRGGKGFSLFTHGKERHDFDAVIISAGSCAAPQVGGSDSGYELLASLGHTIHEPFPAVTPLTIPLKILHRLQGIKWDCRVNAVTGNRVLASRTDELLFTGYGISGPAALHISRHVNEMASQGRESNVVIDFFPGYSSGELSECLESIWNDESKTVSFSLRGVLKERMPEVLCEIAGVDGGKKASRLSGNEKMKIISVLKGLTLEPGKPRSFADAVVAAGGVSVDEVDPSTMESKIVKNLFVAGELLDIDGDSGGYNLQFAWSTGAIAGLAQ